MFALQQNGEDVDRVNGVNAAELVKKVRQYAGLPASSTDKPTADKVYHTFHFTHT